MSHEVLILFIVSIFIVLVDFVLLVKMACLIRKYKNVSVEELSKKMSPLICATGIFSVLLAICQILLVIFR